MQAIWKFPLEITDEQIILMPRRAEILCVQEQQGILCLWAKVYTDFAKEPRHISIYGTGHQHEEISGQYIDTVQQFGGKAVWHVFEKR